jgi:hypothetical protein
VLIKKKPSPEVTSGKYGLRAVPWVAILVWVVWGPSLTPWGNPYRYGNVIYPMAYDILQPLEEDIPAHIPALFSWQRKAFVQGMLRIIRHEDRMTIHALCRDLVDLQVTRMDLKEKLRQLEQNPLPPPPVVERGSPLPDVHALSVNHQHLMWQSKVLKLQDDIGAALDRLLGESS